jgi:hypothetical protein
MNNDIFDISKDAETPKAQLSEHLTLRTIVMTMVTIMAQLYEKIGLGQQQQFVNLLADSCIASLEKSKQASPGNAAIFSAAAAKTTAILSDINLPKVTGAN